MSPPPLKRSSAGGTSPVLGSGRCQRPPAPRWWRLPLTPCPTPRPGRRTSKRLGAIWARGPEATKCRDFNRLSFHSALSTVGRGVPRGIGAVPMPKRRMPHHVRGRGPGALGVRFCLASGDAPDGDATVRSPLNCGRWCCNGANVEMGQCTKSLRDSEASGLSEIYTHVRQGFE